MTAVDLLNSIWVPLVFALLLLVYGVYMLITKDPNRIRKKGDISPLKDPEKYAVTAGWLFVYMAVGCLVMAALIKFVGNDMIVTIQSLTWFLIFAVFWKRMLDNYGPKK